MDAVEAALDANRAYVAGLTALVKKMEAQECTITRRMSCIKEAMRAEHHAAIQEHLAAVIECSSKPRAPCPGNTKKRDRGYFQSPREAPFSWHNPDSLFVRVVRAKFQDFNFPTQRRWLPKEVAALRQAVDMPIWRNGIRWDRMPLVAKLQGRSGHACFLQWTMDLVQALEIMNPWTAEEDSALRALHESSTSWPDIARTMSQSFSTRPAVAYMLRFQRHLQSPQHAKKWTDDDDVALKAAVEVYGGEANVWQLVAESLDGFTPNQCGTRWRQSTCPLVKTGNFSLQDDRRLLLSLGVHQKQQLLHGDTSFAHVDWNLIKDFVAQRTSSQCRERFNDSLHPDLVTSSFSPQEDAVLRHWVGVHGSRSRYKLSEGCSVNDENNEIDDGKYPEPTKMYRPKEWSPEVEEDINDYKNKYGDPDRWENGFIRCTRVKASGYYTYWCVILSDVEISKCNHELVWVYDIYEY
ncbi:hypothetical protein B5M09_002305 [Aphanomyces astaci]|uniref:Myb-like domain-containing protein n=1 Tax=Aphanomyces astaci TaxID=112090 RepID=A0A3R7YSB1_APHAT|nr:hypothetical protein B5M09_002305 [Aphanomyces astaci]